MQGHSTTLPRQRLATPVADTPSRRASAIGATIVDPGTSGAIGTDTVDPGPFTAALARVPGRWGTAAWRLRAACVGHEPRLFDPPSSSEGAAAARQRLRTAAGICRECPAAADCLVDAIQLGDVGLRGGLLLEESHRVRRVDLDVQALQPCGTYAAWRRHRRRGEAVDTACAAARAAYKAQHSKTMSARTQGRPAA